MTDSINNRACSHTFFFSPLYTPYLFMLHITHLARQLFEYLFPLLARLRQESPNKIKRKKNISSLGPAHTQTTHTYKLWRAYMKNMTQIYPDDKI